MNRTITQPKKISKSKLKSEIFIEEKNSVETKSDTDTESVYSEVVEVITQPKIVYTDKSKTYRENAKSRSNEMKKSYKSKYIGMDFNC